MARPTVAPAQALSVPFSMTGPKTLFPIPLATYADLIRGPDRCAGPTMSIHVVACGWPLRLQLAAVGEHHDHARGILQ